MDTPDKAASFSDSHNADATNKDWLLASARSGQLSANMKRHELSWSSESSECARTKSASNFYGTIANNATDHSIGRRGHDLGRQSSATETSWLFVSNQFWSPATKPKKKRRSNRLQTIASDQMTFESDTCTSINGQYLYDNISYAEPGRMGAHQSPNSCSSAQQLPTGVGTNYNPVGCNDKPGRANQSKRRDFCFGKFRILLTSFVLLGITLANYSRNALSLAAVGMIASNVMNRELVEILANDPEVQLNADTTNRIQAALDGSCPVLNSFVKPPSLAHANGTASDASNLTHLLSQAISGELIEAAAATSSSGSGSLQQQQQLELKSAKRKSELEIEFKESIRKRVERGQLVNWSPGELGLISAAGSVGNLLIAIPITRMGEIYGPKWIIFAAALGATIQAAFMPIVATCNVLLVIAFQVVFNGLSYGADCVAYTLFAHWLPPTEMAFFVSCLIICYQLGTMMSSFATARILSQGISWSWCFYTPAILCATWTLVWALVGASEPLHSKLISKRELAYLLESSKISQTLHNQPAQRSGSCGGGGVGGNEQQPSNGDAKLCARQARVGEKAMLVAPLGSQPVSWSKLARDPNIWAIINIKFTLRWFFSVSTSLMPTYLSSVVHMSVDNIGTVSVGQSAIGLVLGVLMGYLTKSLITRRPFNWTLATTRKCAQSIVNFGIALSLLAFIAFDCNQLVTIVSLTLGGFCMCFYVAGALQIPLDLSPTHCGLITSITNTLALGQALGAPISGLILNGGPRDRTRWRCVWAIAIVMNTLSGLIFILLVDSKPRDYTKKYSNQLANGSGRVEPPSSSSLATRWYDEQAEDEQLRGGAGSKRRRT